MWRKQLTAPVHRALAGLPYPANFWYHLWLGRRRMSEARREAERVDRRVSQKLAGGDVVRNGPFRGMRYPALSHGSVLLPKIVGTYEQELHDSVEQIIALAPDVIVDIGAAEGYYAVGLALRCQRRIVAFEMHDRARAMLDHLARLNGVRGLIDLRGRCEPPVLDAVLADAASPAVLSDCEGAEDRLLDPDVVGPLRKAIMLVEVHDSISPGVTARLRHRFADTHECLLIGPESRQPATLDPDGRLTSVERQRLVDERRDYDNAWLFMRPHHTT